jgi:hypothetical protein
MSDINNEPPKRFGTTVTITICGTIAFLAVLGAFVFLETSGKGTVAFMGFLAFAAAAIPGILNYKQSREIKNVAEEVKEQTNGPLSAKFEELNNKLTGLSGKVHEVQRTQDSYRNVMRQINPTEIPMPRQSEESNGSAGS